MGFEVLARSPLLIPHVRNPGGKGGRRIEAGLLDGEYAVRVLPGGSPTLYGSAQAAVHAFNAELERARRDGLTSSPEPVALRVADLN
jgi:hypothetical protein